MWAKERREYVRNYEEKRQTEGGGASQRPHVALRFGQGSKALEGASIHDSSREAGGKYQVENRSLTKKEDTEK